MYYIIRTNKYIGAFYHVRQRGIVRRVYINGRWQPEQVIAENCRENFSAHYENDTLYIFCQDSQGDIISVTINDSNSTVNSRVVLKNQSDHVLRIILHPIISENGLTLIYNSAGAEDRSNYLMTLQIDKNGQWSTAERIDKYWSDGFEVQRVADDHLLLFYQTRTPENNLGYREFTPEQRGNFNVYYTTNYYISDTAGLTTDNGVHTLFVVKSMFSNQLIYRRNINGSFSSQIILYEAQRIENCLLFFMKDNLYVTFLSAGSLFICMSDDKGASFSRPVRYRNKFCQNPEKAYFISQSAQSENSMFLRQVYVDRSCPWDIQIIPEMSEDFFPAYSEKNEDKQGFESDYAIEVERLKNQIELLQRNAYEKDTQIASLSRMVSERNAELADLQHSRNSIVSADSELEESISNNKHETDNATQSEDNSPS